MDVLKEATEWAKAEVFSSQFFILFGVAFVIGSFGFRYMAKTDVARAFVTPTLVVGVILFIIGTGLFAVNKMRISQFAEHHERDEVSFVETEIARGDKTVAEFNTVVFKAIPLIIVACALMLIFIDKPGWRATNTAVIAMMAVILMVDSSSKARIAEYTEKLKEHQVANSDESEPGFL